MRMDSALMGILAVIAGVLILFHWLDLTLVVGVYLIIFGILMLVRR